MYCDQIAVILAGLQMSALLLVQNEENYFVIFFFRKKKLKLCIERRNLDQKLCSAFTQIYLRNSFGGPAVVSLHTPL